MIRSIKNKIKKTKRSVLGGSNSKKKVDIVPGAEAVLSARQKEESDSTVDTDVESVAKIRSVNDYQSADDLKKALTSGVEGSCSFTDHAWLFSKEQDALQKLLQSKGDSDEFAVNMKDVDQKLDWVLENYDESTTEQQSIQHELRRLLVLKSYLVLDTERKESFERVTALASERFSCPIAVISLVDIGRQWFLSNRGLPEEARETPRKLAFCSHAIMSKLDCLVVPDASKDFRFKDNPLVKGPPDIRFYAGAPLLSPEGYKLGTVCVIDSKPRIDPFTAQDKEDLKNYAAMAVQTLLDHRGKMSSWFNNLVSTHYPKFEIPDETESSLTNEGDDTFEQEEQILKAAEAKEEKNNSQDDLNVFLETTKRMPLKDMLEMLQNQAKEQNVPTDYLKRYAELAKLEEKRQEGGGEGQSNEPIVNLEKQLKSMRAPKQKKHFRFAENNEQHVVTDIQIVDSWKENKQLWWSADEIHSIRQENVKTIRFFKKKRHDYVRWIEFVSKQKQSPTSILERLVEDSLARGLESHIVSGLRRNRRITIQAVLDEQGECKGVEEDLDTLWYCISEQSILYSESSRLFAEKLGLCDQLDVMRNFMRPKP